MSLPVGLGPARLAATSRQINPRQLGELMIARLRIIPITFLLVICASGFPQTRSEEFTILRDHLKLPAATPVKLVTTNSLSSDAPFRICIVVDEEIITPR